MPCFVPSWYPLTVTLLTYLVVLTEPLIDTELPLVDVPHYLNLNSADPDLVALMKAVYQLQETDFLKTEGTLIYVQPCVSVSWRTLDVALLYGLYNLSTGTTTLAANGAELPQKELHRALYWQLNMGTHKMGDILSNVDGSMASSMAKVINGLYHVRYFSQSTKALLRARIYVNIVLQMLCLVTFVFWCIPLTTRVHTQAVSAALATLGAMLMCTNLVLFAVFNSRLRFRYFVPRVFLLCVDLAAILMVLLEIVTQRLATTISPAKVHLTTSANSAYSLGTSMVSTPAQPQNDVPPTVDIIKSLSSNEEKMHYRGQIRPPNFSNAALEDSERDDEKFRETEPGTSKSEKVLERKPLGSSQAQESSVLEQNPESTGSEDFLQSSAQSDVHRLDLELQNTDNVARDRTGEETPSMVGEQSAGSSTVTEGSLE